MINANVREKIKTLELYTRRLMNANILGNSRSRVKGSGLDFDQLRDYYSGDDVRSLDWNSSARMNKLLVKQFNDERHRTILIALDISASLLYGSDGLLKQEISAQIAALLSYAGLVSKDEVGLILFSDTIELYIPPKKGKSHNYQILEKIFSLSQKNIHTNINKALEYIIKLRKKNMMVFFISDFISDVSYEKNIALVNRMCDLIAIQILDTAEQNLPINALITIKDSETGQEGIINVRKDLKDNFNCFLKERIEKQKKLFASCSVDVVTIASKTPLLETLIHFFQSRKR